MQQPSRTKRTPFWLMGLVVGLVIVATLAIGAVQAAPSAGPLLAIVTPPRTPGVSGTDYEVGNWCVDDYQPSSNCTANDVVIANIYPAIQDICLVDGEYTAPTQFRLTLQTNATQRYDIGMFVAMEGGSAQTGDNCYHDVLQEASTAGPWGLTSGYGDFKELEGGGDTCADSLQNDGSIEYYIQYPISVLCVDSNDDGLFDGISACTSWDNQIDKVICTNVKHAYPNTKSKCRCETISGGGPAYGGDWGDLPNSYGTVNTSNGARHVMTSTVTYPGVWLGPSVDYSPTAESNGLPTTGADGDDNNVTDDENGVTLPIANWSWGTVANGYGGTISVNVGGGTCTNCHLAFWFDWNNDGDFADTDESYVKSVVSGTQTLTFDIPNGALLDAVYSRFRLYDGRYTSGYSPTGRVLNGEVEDYHFTPTAVELLSFDAAGLKKAISLKWETSTEVDNAGFNLYRATRVNGPRTKLNSELIPSNVYPGSPVGAAYEFTDTDVKPLITYYYWLEDVDISGVATLHGPDKATAR